MCVESGNLAVVAESIRVEHVLKHASTWVHHVNSFTFFSLAGGQITPTQYQSLRIHQQTERDNNHQHHTLIQQQLILRWRTLLLSLQKLTSKHRMRTIFSWEGEEPPFAMRQTCGKWMEVEGFWEQNWCVLTWLTCFVSQIPRHRS